MSHEATNINIEVGESFTPVTRLDTVRLVLAIATENKWPISQLDVKSAFLNGILEEEVYVDQTLGFEVHGQEQSLQVAKGTLWFEASTANMV